MTPEQVQIIRLTFAQVMQRKMEVGRLFYDRLFTIAPDTRSMFKGNMEEQARKLMETLALAIGTLQDASALSGILEGLAKRHVGYGVHDEHYDKVGEALLWTLQRGLGDAFTPSVKDAWTTLYGTVANTMKQSAAAKSSNPAAA